MSIAQATTYYIASTGNDSNNGLTTATAWKTIAKVNQVSLATGDTVLFNRGDTFRGAIDSSGFTLGIHFDAYGTGANPVIAGSVKITNWQPSLRGAKFYEADVSQYISTVNNVTNTIENLFANGLPMTIARYPNVASPVKINWLKVDASVGTDAITDSALAAYNKPLDYWKGATLRIRTYSWYYKSFPITASDKGKIVAPGLGIQFPRWGYFIDNKFEELDYPGEWFYDAALKKVYFYPPKNVDPNTMLIEGSTYKNGLSIDWHEDNNTVKNLTFKHFTSAGVYINNSASAVVQNCRFEYNFMGVNTWNPLNLLIDNNTFEQQLNTGILLNAASGFNVGESIATKNKINNTGMIPAYCQRYNGYCNGIGIAAYGRGFIMRENTLNKSGWVGIFLKADGGHLTENNTISNAMMLLNDGGAIVVASNDNIVRGNFLLNTIGNVDDSNGCTDSATSCYLNKSYGMGVGADENFKNILIENNTIAGNHDWGIRVNAFTNSKVLNNVLFNNRSHIFLDDRYGVAGGNTVSGNIAYSAQPEQIAVGMTNSTEYGLVDSNFYCNPYSGILFNRNNRNYSFAQWRDPIFNPFNSIFPQDVNSQQCAFEFPEYLTTASGAEMFSNTSFTSNVTAWYGGVYEATTTGMSGGSLKYTNPATTGYVNYENLSLTSGQYYRMRFKLKGSSIGNVELQINDATDHSNIQVRFFAYSNTTKSYELVFKSSRNTIKGEVIFISRNYDAANYWLDDVSLQPVTAQVAQKPGTLFSNATALTKTIPLTVPYTDLQGTRMGASITLNPYSSQILIKQ